MDLMDKIVSLCKRRGFIYSGSEIYGGLQGFWDYGPLGTELKRNLKHEWWQFMVYQRDDVVGIDAAIIMNPEVWKASGHVDAFTDPLVECKKCHQRFRTDQLISKPQYLEAARDEAQQVVADILKETGPKIDFNEKRLEALKNLKFLTKEEGEKVVELIKIALPNIKKGIEEIKNKQEIAGLLVAQIMESKQGTGFVTQIYLNRHERCPNCGSRNWDLPKKFNLLTEVYLGDTEPKLKAYLRGEITQGVFVNFKNVVDSSRVKVPFGIAQIGKAFRNEITPGNFTFRSREFEQMELEFFIKPDDQEGKKWFEYWKKQRLDWYVSLGLDKAHLRFREHAPDERAHYARAAEDIEYQAPFGWKEFEGIHHRGDWDLSRHHLTYKDEDNQEYTPWVIETSGGVDRAALFFLIDAYRQVGDRVVLKLHPKLAPYKAAVFPLLSNKPELVDKAKAVFQLLKQQLVVTWDDRGNIGKRYYAQDEIGTPWCITIDFDTLKDDTVTVRDRDTAKQERISIDQLAHYLQEKLK